jgi:hypothetical protein
MASVDADGAPPPEPKLPDSAVALMYEIPIEITP